MLWFWIFNFAGGWTWILKWGQEDQFLRDCDWNIYQGTWGKDKETNIQMAYALFSEWENLAYKS